jgi:hypothetical protein
MEITMSDIQRLLIEEAGETYELFVESKSTATLLPPSSTSSSQRPDAMGVREDAVVRMQQAHRMIRGYVTYALSALRGIEGADIQEVNLRFGLKLGGKAGIPYITEGSAESNLEISVKCTFPQSKKQ